MNLSLISIEKHEHRIPEVSNLATLYHNGRWYLRHIRMEGGRSLTHQIYKISERVKTPPSSQSITNANLYKSSSSDGELQ